MKRDNDIEGLLKRYSSEPRPGVKHSVLRRFSAAFPIDVRPVGLWKRPIPLYVAAAAVILALGLSFFAGSRAGAPRTPESLQSIQPAAAPAVTWEAAVSDVL